LRYQLLVAHLLERGLSVTELLSGPRAAEPIERELRDSHDP
jgi:hypothetical protein